MSVDFNPSNSSNPGHFESVTPRPGDRLLGVIAIVTAVTLGAFGIFLLATGAGSAAGALCLVGAGLVGTFGVGVCFPNQSLKLLERIADLFSFCV